MDTFEICDEIDVCLNQLDSDRNLAVATSRLHVRSLPLYENIFCFDETQNVYSYLNSFMIRSDFKDKSSFNHMIELAVASGLASKLKNDIRFHTKITTLSGQFGSIRLNDFYFFLCLINLPILILANLVLLTEKLIFKKSHSVNGRSFWKFLEKLICGHRCFCLLKPKNDDIIMPFTM